MAKSKMPAPVVADLPPDVIEDDTKYVSLTIADHDKVPADIRYSGLTFYKTAAFGWVVCTLPISSGRRQGLPDRTYAIKVDGGAICRVGRGPHVLKTVTVYVYQRNIGRLQKYVDLWLKGMAAAGSVRDRISSRRAEGQVKRAQGLHSWRWDS